MLSKLFSFGKNKYPDVVSSLRQSVIDNVPCFVDKHIVGNDELQFRGWALPGHKGPSAARFYINSSPPDDISYPLPSKGLEEKFGQNEFAGSAGYSVAIHAPQDEIFSNSGFAELEYQRNGTPDERSEINRWWVFDPRREQPMPEGERAYRVVGDESVENYLLGGATIYKRLEYMVSRYFDPTLFAEGPVFDWGCGSGRVTRYFVHDKIREIWEIWGGDVDKDNLAWCEHAFPQARFIALPLDPPSKLPANHFNFVFGISVFTHLREKAQMQWLEELHRITAPGGGLVMSVRGDTSLGFGFNRKLNEWVYLRERDGYLNVGVDSRINEQLEDQSYYVNCLQSRKYIQEKWGAIFRHPGHCQCRGHSSRFCNNEEKIKMKNLFFIAALFVLASSASAIQFENITERSGISYVGTAWSAAWRDFNNDGLPDLWASNHGGRPSLYINKGNGRFEKTTGVLQNDTPRDGHAATWADVDNDGDADLMEVTGAVLGSGEGANQLFQNTGKHLNNIATESGVDYALGRGRVPLWLDYNNDGLLDLLIMNQSRADGKAPSALFRNRGETFQRLDDPGLSALKRTANDTFALLSNLSGTLPMELAVFGTFPPPFSPRIYAIQKSSFKEITSEIIKAPISDVFDAVTADFNGDLKPDLYISRYHYASDIAVLTGKNARASIFNNGAQVRGLDIHTTGNLRLAIHLPTVKWDSSMIFFGKDSSRVKPVKKEIISLYYTLDSKDRKLQGKPQIAGTRKRAIYVWFDPEANLWRLRFTSQTWAFLQLEITAGTGLSGVDPIGFNKQPPPQPQLLLSTDQGYQQAALPVLPGCTSAAAADFDNDTDVDLFLVCTQSVVNTPDLLLENKGKGVFSLVHRHGAEGTNKGIGQKAAIADIDNDGFQDLFVINGLGPASPLTRGPYQLFHNKGNDNHWLKLRLEGTLSNKDGIGAQVVIQAGGKTQLREQNGKSHYGAQDDITMHFGLLGSTMVDKISIHWPSGTTQNLQDIKADQTLHIVESSAENQQ